MVDHSVANRKQLFLLLVLFRWLSLIPPLAAIFLTPAESAEQLRLVIALLMAIVVNGVISLFAEQLSKLLRKKAWILGIDLLFVSALMALTGGWRSPYYLYFLSPVLAAAFFFQVRGAIVSIAILLPLYFTAVTLSTTLFAGPGLEWLVIIMFVIGVVLIGITVGYVSQLLNQLQLTKDTLYRRHQELQVLHDFGNSLQLSTSVDGVVNQTIVTITRELGFGRAVIGLIDFETQVIYRWQRQDGRQEGINSQHHFEPVSLLDKNNVFSRALRQQEIIRFGDPSIATKTSALPLVNHHELAGAEMAQFDIKDGLLLPMYWGVKPIGILLVDLEDRRQDTVDLTVLDAIARQTAATLGMMMTRLRHAKESAVQEERTRIALDLHDTISQSLFGLVYTLQGCLKLLKEDPQKIEPELEWALATAQDVRRKIRNTIHNIWPAELTAKQFEDDLRVYAADVLQAAELDIAFDIRGEFNTLSPPVRRGMYRICQESLTNIVHHASAHQSRICVDVAEGRARIILRDNGRGFEPEVALAQDFEDDHFGLRGMRERAAALGGTCEIYSQPGAGTSILIDIPANAQAHHE